MNSRQDENFHFENVYIKTESILMKPKLLPIGMKREFDGREWG